MHSYLHLRKQSFKCSLPPADSWIRTRCGKFSQSSRWPSTLLGPVGRQAVLFAAWVGAYTTYIEAGYRLRKDDELLVLVSRQSAVVFAFESEDFGHEGQRKYLVTTYHHFSQNYL